VTSDIWQKMCSRFKFQCHTIWRVCGVPYKSTNLYYPWWLLSYPLLANTVSKTCLVTCNVPKIFCSSC